MALSNPLTQGLLGMQYEFTTHQNSKGEWYFVYRNQQGNKEPICWSEGYATRQGCLDAINKVKGGAATAPIR